jgi:hypothetical protein
VYIHDQREACVFRQPRAADLQYALGELLKALANVEQSVAFAKQEAKSGFVTCVLLLQSSVM